MFFWRKREKEMRTRRLSYPLCCSGENFVVLQNKRKRHSQDFAGKQILHRQKQQRFTAENYAGQFDFFDSVHDDLVILILTKLSSTANSPSDFINVFSTCKRLNELSHNPLVLSKASPKTFAVTAKKWCDSAHRFQKLCADAGNIEACYTLGMIRFYCLKNRASGAALMAKAAISSHATALYSLAVIQFNGSGGSKNDKDLRAGVALCARAAFLGHIDALREFGHCLQDGYGVRRSISDGRRFLVQANARELASVVDTRTLFNHYPYLSRVVQDHNQCLQLGPLLSDFGCNIPAPIPHPASQFLSDWFGSRTEPGSELRMCSQVGCGRPETRRHEFRRCSVCGAVNYCSRACQALDWKMRHKAECVPMDRWLQGDNDGDGDGIDIDNDVIMVES